MEDPCWCRLQDLEIAVALAPTHKNGWANDGVPKLLDGTNMGLLGLNVALVPKNATPNAVHASAPSCGLFATHPSQVINGHPQPEDTTRERDMRKWFEENQASLKKSGKRRHEEPLSSGETELSMERPECWMQETEPIEGLADRITLDHCPRGGYVDPAQPWNLADRQGPVRFSVSVNAILKSLEGLREGACVDIGLANMGISDIAPALLFVFGTFGVRSHTHAAFTSAQEEQFKCFMRHIFGQLEDGFDFARRGSAAMKHFQQGLTDAPAWGRPPNCPQPDRWDPEKGQGYFSLVALNLLYCSLGNVTRRNGELMLDLRTKTDWSIYFYMSPTALSPRFHRSTLFDILFSVVAMNPATIHNGYINTNLITPFDNQQSFAPFLRSPMSTNDKKRPYFMFLYMQRQVYGGPPPTAGSSIIYSFVIQPNANATDPPFCNTTIVPGLAPGVAVHESDVYLLCRLRTGKQPLRWPCFMWDETTRVWEEAAPILSSAHFTIAVRKASNPSQKSSTKRQISRDAHHADILYAAMQGIRNWACREWRQRSLKGDADWFPTLLRRVMRNTALLPNGPVHGLTHVFRLDYKPPRVLPPIAPTAKGVLIAPEIHRIAQAACKRLPGIKGDVPHSVWRESARKRKSSACKHLDEDDVFEEGEREEDAKDDSERAQKEEECEEAVAVEDHETEEAWSQQLAVARFLDACKRNACIYWVSVGASEMRQTGVPGWIPRFDSLAWSQLIFGVDAMMRACAVLLLKENALDNPEWRLLTDCHFCVHEWQDRLRAVTVQTPESVRVVTTRNALKLS
jgi:hypothetical protein